MTCIRTAMHVKAEWMHSVVLNAAQELQQCMGCEQTCLRVDLTA